MSTKRKPPEHHHCICRDNIQRGSESEVNATLIKHDWFSGVAGGQRGRTALGSNQEGRQKAKIGVITTKMAVIIGPQASHDFLGAAKLHSAPALAPINHITGIYAAAHCS